MTEYDWISLFLAVVAFMWVGVAIACWSEKRKETHDPYKEPWM